MSRSRIFPVMLAFTALVTLSSCTQKDMDQARFKAENQMKQDRELNYTRDDYRRGMAPMNTDESDRSVQESSIPDLAPVIAETKKNILPQPLVSISVNQDVSLRDIFFELAKQAEVDLELDPTITGSVIFTAYNRPFDQVVERIADMAGLRYHFEDNVLRVERDTPYMKTYKLDYLSMVRTFDSQISSNTSAASSGSSGSGGTNGSNSTIKSNSKSDFWDELQASIAQIISNTNQQVNLTDQSAPITSPTAIPAVSPSDLTAITPPAGGATGATPAAMPAPIAGLANPTGTQTVAGQDAAEKIEVKSDTAIVNPYFSFNKQAGLLNIFASQKQHEKIEDYLEKLRRTVSSQILVEAKVFEVELNDESATGIDWNAVVGEFSAGTSLARQPFSSNPVGSGVGSVFSYAGNDFDFLIDAISRFGTVRTLSSPRLTVMNNQTAVLNVSESRVFFDLTINRTTGTANTPPTTDITSEVKSVPEGVIIAVHPSVDLDSNEILMNLRPSITRVVNTVNDPAVGLLNIPDVENPVPELSVRELDSVVRMRSGETAIMGGLMQDRAASEQQSIPVLGEVPMIGGLFRNQLDRIKKTEMVIFLRATVVPVSKPSSTDKNLYKKFGSTDRRPFPM